MILENGTVINGRYSIKSCIGQGGFGITYLAHDERLMQDVVLKEYFPDFMVRRDESNTVQTVADTDLETYEKGKTRFLNEARLLALLRDLSEIVTIFDYFLENNTAYIVMEYIDGNSLKSIIKARTAPYTFNEAMRIMMPCIDALQKVHEHGLIHRDFTPDNILLTKKGEVRIIDFGASKDYISAEKTMTVMVKHGYAPLEQYAQDGKQGTWTDVYSACAIIYEMLTLRKPQSAIDRSMQDNVDAASIQNNSLSLEKKNVILKGLSLKSRERYQTLQELIQDLKKPDKAQVNTGASAAAAVPRNAAYQDDTMRFAPGYNNSQQTGSQQYSGGQQYTTSQQYTNSQTYGRSQQYTVSQQYTTSQQYSSGHTEGSKDENQKSAVLPIIVGALSGIAVLGVIIATIVVFSKNGTSKNTVAEELVKEEENNSLDEFETVNALDNADNPNNGTDDSGYEKPTQQAATGHDTSTGNWDISIERKIHVKELNATVPIPAGYNYISRDMDLEDPYVSYRFSDDESYEAFVEEMKASKVYIVAYPDNSDRNEMFYICGEEGYDGSFNYNDFESFTDEEWKEVYEIIESEAEKDGTRSIEQVFNYRDSSDNILIGYKAKYIQESESAVKVAVANGQTNMWVECIAEKQENADHMVTQLVNMMQRVLY